MADAPYDPIADEYYDPSHKTSRNFDATSLIALRSIVPLVPAGRILEVGAGRGRCGEFLGIDTARRVVQLDNSARMLAVAPREEALLQVVHSAESLPFPDGHFSCVAAFLCDPFLGLNFLGESHRVLSPGGVLVATTPAYEWGAPLRENLQLEVNQTRFVTRDGNRVVVPSVLVSREQLTRMLRKVGYADASIQVQAHRLPQGTTPVSSDIEQPAKLLGRDAFALDVLYTIVAGR